MPKWKQTHVLATEVVTEGRLAVINRWVSLVCVDHNGPFRCSYLYRHLTAEPHCGNAKHGNTIAPFMSFLISTYAFLFKNIHQIAEIDTNVAPTLIIVDL